MEVTDPSSIAVGVFHGKSKQRRVWAVLIQLTRDASRNGVNKAIQVTSECNVNVEHKVVPIATAPEKLVGEGTVAAVLLEFQCKVLVDIVTIQQDGVELVVQAILIVDPVGHSVCEW